MRIFFSVFMTGPQGNLPTILDSRDGGGEGTEMYHDLFTVTELKENSISIDFRYMLLKRFSSWFIQEHTLICKTDVFMKCCTLPDSILKYPKGSHCIQQSLLKNS